MKLEDISTIINNIEARFNVDEWEIDGIKLWPFIRIDNATLMSYQIVDVAVPKTKSASYVKKIFKAKFDKLKAQFIDGKKNAELSKADVLLLGDGVSYTKLKNLWYEKFCDPIYDYYSLNNIKTIRLDLSHNFLIPRHSPSIFIQPVIDNVIIKSKLKDKLKEEIEFDNENWSDFDDFFNEGYANEFLPNLPSKEAIRVRISKIKSLKAHFSEYILKVQPKIAFVVCYYSDTVMSFLLACREHGIKTVDIQHGVQGEMHRAYGKWMKVPQNGYPSLPDYFWVWSEAEKSTIDFWNAKVSTHKAIVCSNAFAELWMDNSNEMVKEYDKEFLQSKKIPGGSTILLTLSPGMLTEELMAETWEVVKETQNTYNWFIRLHPAMLNDIEVYRENITSKGIARFEMDICSALPLYSILRNIDIHITTQSSTVIEAADFGVKSIISSSYGQSLYNRFIENNSAYLCKTSTEIKLKINELLMDRDLRKSRLKGKKKDVFGIFNNIIKDAREYNNS